MSALAVFINIFRPTQVKNWALKRYELASKEMFDDVQYIHALGAVSAFLLPRSTNNGTLAIVSPVTIYPRFDTNVPQVYRLKTIVVTPIPVTLICDKTITRKILLLILHI